MQRRKLMRWDLNRKRKLLMVNQIHAAEWMCEEKLFLSITAMTELSQCVWSLQQESTRDPDRVNKTCCVTLPLPVNRAAALIKRTLALINQSIPRWPPSCPLICRLYGGQRRAQQHVKCSAVFFTLACSNKNPPALIFLSFPFFKMFFSSKVSMLRNVLQL